MGFWRNVEDRREYLGISRKELAQKVGISYGIIGAGLERDSVPIATTAVKIAKVLQIPLENLLQGYDIQVENEHEDVPEKIKSDAIIKKCWNVYNDLEKLPIEQKEILIETIHRFSNLVK